MRHSLLILLASLAISSAHAQDNSVKLFPNDGVPKDWIVTQWSDLSLPADPATLWKVQDGVLHGSEPRGTWLVSQKEYSDFQLEFEWKLGDQGNSGVALRTPLKGDPAFDAIEIQMADPRYMPADNPMLPSELTGAIYRAVPPTQQLYKPNAWNHYKITCQGPLLKVELNGQLIQDINLDTQSSAATRHNGAPALPLKQRPRSGRIGFQELSRGGDHVQIRNARIRQLP